MSDSRYDRVVDAFRSKGLGTTQVAIAKKLGISQASVSAWRRGVNIKDENVEQICRLTGVAPDWLRYGRGPKYPIGSDLAELLRKLEALDPETRRKALLILDALAGDRPNNH